MSCAWPLRSALSTLCGGSCSRGPFSDTTPPARLFGVLGTAFAVVLAFVIFLSFQSYGEAKTQAGVEAVTITELHRNASLFDDATQAELQGGLICYARTVIEDKWPLMRERRSSPRVTQWVADVSSAVDGAEVSGV